MLMFNTLPRLSRLLLGFDRLFLSLFFPPFSQVSISRAHLQQWGKEAKHTRIPHTQETGGREAFSYYRDGGTQPWIQTTCWLQVWLQNSLSCFNLLSALVVMIVLCFPFSDPQLHGLVIRLWFLRMNIQKSTLLDFWLGHGKIFKIN